MRRERPRLGRGTGRARLDTALTWLASTSAALGGLALLGRRPVPIGDEGEASGRGSPSTPPSKRAVSLGFEPHDMSGRDMALLVAGLGASAAAVIGLMFAMLGYFHAQDRAARPPFTPEQVARIEPPLPHLQDHPKADLREQIAREEGLLHGYAWLGPDHARARIPIDRAMALAVGRPLDAAP